MTRYILALTLTSALAMGGCATAGTDATFKGDRIQDVDSAVASPVYDVGLEDIDIPVYLSRMTNPYAKLPGDCAAAKAEIEMLDRLLGADMDVPEDEDAKREQTALQATSSTIGGLLPFRGIIRAISGATRNRAQAREAYERGLVRRAYLKGVAEEMDDCSV
ncbi:hypothetical protein [uncultured Algimonas sp.]|uniref:hypothetical protein n=1 Tax=uncultured Algimonas sp. TaxID=1547920 RepID=UPI0026190B36|nr:hypothetical protein [uncultured Algimonas sp.]